ncbi:MAG TPA: DUF885 domain-containing protein [Solimonas sp.]|nr:DUF885 domain-containing protein [Solimonas sp.]
MSIRSGARRGLVVLLALAAGFLQSVAWANAADDRFRAQFGDRFLDRYWSLNPDYAIVSGYYRYADRLTVLDASFRRDYLRFLDAQIAALAALPVAQMSEGPRTDQAVLLNSLRSERWALAEAREWVWDPSSYNVADGFALLLNTPYAPEVERLRTVSARLARVPAYYAAAKANIERPTRPYTQLAIQQNEGALGVFGEDLERQVAGSTLRAEERALFLRRLAAARAAIGDYVHWLKALTERLDREQGWRDFRLGPALYEQGFAYQVQTGGTARQLYERALQEKDRLHARMATITDQLWPKYFGSQPPPADRVERIGALIAKLSEKHVKREDFVAATQAMIPQLEAWVRDHDLLSQDPTRPLVVRVTPPYKRGYAMASIDAPGPYDPTANTYYNVTPLDDYTPEQAESFLREYNHWLFQILNIHEAVPGHYLQLIHANKSPSRIKTLFGNSAMIEGWAVYSERMMLESGWGGHEPEMELMHAKWLLRVTCNTILDYSVHALQMTEAEGLQLLMREAFQSETEARGKWRRVSVSSVQLTYYFAGFSAIYDYRERLKAELGERFDLKRFHEKFLSYGNASVAMIESLMKAEDVARR